MDEITPAPEVRTDPEQLKRAATACRNIRDQAARSTDWFAWVPDYLDSLAAALAELDAEQ